MANRNFINSAIGLLLHLSLPAFSQETATDSASETTRITPAAQASKVSVWHDLRISGGQLTLPFKIRPKADTRSFRLTTDVTIGAYIGLTKRLLSGKEFFLTIPLAGGLSFINLNDSNTLLDPMLQEAEVVPGLTWCTGLILQLEGYNIGLMIGKDYASEVGDQWRYHRRLWWSFGIGFSFFH